MKKIIYIIIIVCILAVLLFIYLTGNQDVKEIKEYIENEYGGNVTNVIYEPDCSECTDTGCYYLGEQCWKANVTTENEFHEIVLDSKREILDYRVSSSGSGSESEGNPPTQQIVTECQSYYSTTSGQDLFVYSNTGCTNPKPMCKNDKCDQCNTPIDCIGLVENFRNSQQLTTEMRIISTQYNGYYDHNTRKCIIDDNVITIYENTTSYQLCYDVVISHLQCNSGICDFI